MENSIRKVVDLYFEGNLSEAQKLLEDIILEKTYKAIQAKKESFYEGEIKVNNKKKKNKLEVRAGRAVGGISAKHTGRNLFRTMQPNQLKAILATEQFLKTKPFDKHIKYSNPQKHHLRFQHPELKRRRNRRAYKNLQTRIDR